MKTPKRPPLMEEKPLLTYVIHRGEELIAQEDPTPGRIWLGRALTEAGHCPDQHETLQEFAEPINSDPTREDK